MGTATIGLTYLEGVSKIHVIPWHTFNINGVYYTHLEIKVLDTLALTSFVTPLTFHTLWGTMEKYGCSIE